MAAVTTMSGTPTASPKCRICGRHAPPGAALCVQCKAAVKRARQVPTVMSQVLPLALSMPGGHGGTPEAPGVPRARAAAPTTRSSKPAGWSAFAAVAVFGIAACFIGYFVALQGDDDTGPTEFVRPAPVAARAPDPRVAPAATPAIDSPAGFDAAPAGEEAPAPGTVAPQRPAPSGAPHRRAPAAARAGDRPPSTASALPVEIEAAAPPSGPAQGDRVAPPPVAPAAAPVVPDRWEAMAAAIARCGREDFFSAVVCEQRVRLKSCEGYWGEVPQCGRSLRLDGSGQR